MPDEVRNSLIALYDAEIAQWDHHLGVLWEELDRRGRLENALVIVTSDHGEAFYEHEVWLHGNSLFNEVLRVPLLVYRSWDPDPVRVYDPVTNTRIPHLIRTLLARPAGTQEEMDPSTLLAAPSGKVVAQYSYGHGDTRGAALIDRNWKSLVTTRGTVEFRGLFDLDADPGEAENMIFRDPASWESGVVAIMPTTRAAKGKAPLSRATEELLESLGYTN